ncbi:recombination-associated protein RdgC [Gilvimarinus sp. F26214L]|uniref:recombination-associated protein RdgC n=1 Tax=Gilvimarinus sp. DZF01 TaxID=3461371 RepID=UPI00404584E0
MWFKNLLIYRFTKPFTLTPEQLDQQLAEKPFTGCGSQDMVSRGWTAPLSQEGAPLVHAAGSCMMLCLQRQEKVLPAAVVNEFVDEKVAEIKEREDRHVSRKEKAEIKEQTVFELLPRAFVRSRKQFAYIDTRQQLLVVNSGSSKQAEEFIVTLRETIDTVPVVPLRPHNDMTQCMTRWLAESIGPEKFAIGGECELQDRSDTATVVKGKNLDLQASEIKSHVNSGMVVKKLELAWDGGIEFIVDENMAIKRLRFDDLILDQLDDIQADTVAERFDADFALMAAEFERFIPALVDAFGGPENGQSVTGDGEKLQSAPAL